MQPDCAAVACDPKSHIGEGYIRDAGAADNRDVATYTSKSGTFVMCG
jgi:hypothetical protein